MLLEEGEKVRLADKADVLAVAGEIDADRAEPGLLPWPAGFAGLLAQEDDGFRALADMESAFHHATSRSWF